MSDFTLFLGKFLTQGTAIASLAPSSPWLSRATVRNVDWSTVGSIVELGAGTGPITRVIAERARRETRVIVVERDPDFARILVERYRHLPNFDIIQGDVRDLATMLAERGVERVDHVISGLPVPSFPRELQDDLFKVVAGILDEAGTFNQITELPLVYWRFYRRYFRSVTFQFEPRNFPPAGAYFCQGLKQPVGV
jgi:phospholipid N-methyltransferase